MAGHAHHDPDLKTADPELFDLIEREDARQRDRIRPIGFGR